MSVDWTRDEIILACDLVMANGWKELRASRPEVVELSQLLVRAPLHPTAVRDDKFRNPNGVGRKTSDIATQHPDYRGRPTRGNRLDRTVLDEFRTEPERMRRVAAEIRAAIERGDVETLPTSEIVAEDVEAQEGRILFARHLRRERSPELRRRKLAQVQAEGLAVACEVCGFDFAVAYGERGRGYIEVHHVLPLHVSGTIKTRLQDLALLCANCHRMAHRGVWITPSALRELLATS
ncbi:HNH endonuclease [Kribbella kalugense]|uniref:5-methylcytosine-specific restriction protein A n=1 Tax=Kribbella kalugense TaxID=2512221 RepID=A0A4R7ZL93_9ACTN|nr:HNH endonuclease [Kribbella kalugense]TDW18579.1 5-methylcytosine-specific restriction protein A [Kribbella kalugense]